MPEKCIQSFEEDLHIYFVLRIADKNNDLSFEFDICDTELIYFSQKQSSSITSIVNTCNGKKRFHMTDI